MISKISFGSTYKVSSKDNDFNSFLDYKNFAFDKTLENKGYLEQKDRLESKYPYEYVVDTTFVAPNSLDDSIEMFCANKGIKYTKFSPSMTPEGIAYRIDAPTGWMQKSRVNVAGLEKLLQRQSSNIDCCEEDYNDYFKKDVDIMLKKGDKLPATTFVIRNQSGAGTTEDAVNYIKRFGADRLNDNQLFIGFDQRTDDPDHCVFFALRDLGMQDIPVYVDADTQKIGVALGILKP